MEKKEMEDILSQELINDLLDIEEIDEKIDEELNENKYEEELHKSLYDIEKILNNENKYEDLLKLILELFIEDKEEKLIEEFTYTENNIIKYMTNKSEPYYYQEHIYDILKKINKFIKKENNYSIGFWDNNRHTIYLNPDMRYDFDYECLFEGDSEEIILFKMAIYIQVKNNLVEDLKEKYQLN